MRFRILLAFALGAASVIATERADAVSPFEFLRKQNERRQQKTPRPTPPPAKPAAPAAATQPAAPATGATPPAGTQPVAPVTAATTTAPPPYEKDVRRIGEILGALHYLRPLCGADDGLVWRDKMRDLIDADGGPPDRRERLAGAFNQGYSGFQLTYRTCTPSADLAVRRFLAEGAKLTRDIATRHGN